MEAREIECGIIGNSKLLTSEIGEVKYGSDWYDYDSKYNSNNEIIIPNNHTELYAEDELLVITKEENISKAEKLFQ